ncbi:MAG: cob(I)yrinic acid a c-diamide adenosyltransferase [Bacteroidota bacterium]|jgi:cob(I)alamin adenosyltransferase|nr:cob(I)yrinic acid a c-diamide adenosyltransferase [Bacteroidota bacterium]
MAFKIYTKTGDKGQTSLIGGTRIPKFDIRIEAYGTVDELNSNIGLVRDQDIDDHSKSILIEVQDRLFTIGSLLAADPEKNKMQLPEISESDVELLEKEIDKMNESLTEMKHFVLPGGHTTISFCHVARCVCRRAERCVLRLNEQHPVAELIYKYLNRLSDYLFVLSRKFTYDLKAEETPWKPRM